MKKNMLIFCLFFCFAILRADDYTNATVGGINYRYHLVEGGAEIVPGGSYSPVYNSNVLNRLSLTIPSSLNGHPVVSIGPSSFSLCTNLTEVVIPDTVISIGQFAFNFCVQMTSVSIGDSVKTIGPDAFSFCGLTALNIPDSVTTIGDRAFSEGLKINPIRIGTNVTAIGQNAFSRCHAVTSITIPDSVKTIGSRAFYDCWRLASADIGAGVESIGDSAFEGCSSLATVHIGEGVRQIGDWAFARCRIVSIILPDSVISLGIGVFNGCNSLEAVTFGIGITAIPDFTFQGCNFFWLDLPDTIVSIGKDAFEGCQRMRSIGIGAGIKTISDYAFKNCYGLKAVCFQGDAPKNVGMDIYSLTPPDLTSYVPDPSWGWDGFYDLFGIPLSTALPPSWQNRPISHAPLFKVTFDEQGGSDVEDRTYLDVFRETTYGELPVSTRHGYTLLGWFLESGEQVFPAQLIERRHHMIIARWEANLVTVTFNSQGGMTPSPSSKSVRYDSSYGTLATTTRTGYTFAGWWTGVSGTGAEVTSATRVSIATPQTLYAKWTMIQYTLTVTGGSGSGTTYTNQQRVTITANPPATGKEFDRWEGATQYVASSTSSTTTVTMPAQAITLTATYRDILYTLTVNNGTGGGSYTNQQRATIAAAAPEIGKTFDCWMGDTQYVASVTSSNTTVTMPAQDISVTASYKDILYSLTVEQGSGGGTSYTYRQQVEIEAERPPVGYVFYQWVGATQYVSSVTSSVAVVTMPAQDLALSATYRDVNTHVLTISGGIGGGFYFAGESVEISADTPLPGRTFDRWTGDTAQVADVNAATTTVVMPSSPVSLSAEYRAIQYTLSVSASGKGRIEPSGEIQVEHGATQIFTAVPDVGYQIKHWLAGLDVVAEGQSTLSVIADGDKTVSVVFEAGLSLSSWLVFEGRSQRQMLDETGGKRGEPVVVKETLSTLLVVNRDRPGQTNAVLVSWGKSGVQTQAVVAVSMDDSYPVSAKNDKAGRPAAERNLWSLCIRDDAERSVLIGTFDGAYRYDKSGVLIRVQQRASLTGAGLSPEDPSFSAGLLRLNQTAGDALTKADGDFAVMAAALRAQIKKLPTGVTAETLSGLLQNAAGE